MSLVRKVSSDGLNSDFYNVMVLAIELGVIICDFLSKTTNEC